jgi:surfeit locus 1 family protein
MPRALFTRRWLLANLLVLAALAALVRLGIWQLDRLEWRRAHNARVQENQQAPTLRLDTGSLDADFYDMEFRSVIVTGEYLMDDEIVLRNQIWGDEFGTRLGVKLFTPLLIPGTDSAILVERGWIPADDAANPARAQYAVDGEVTVEGWLRRAETDLNINLNPDPTLAHGEQRLDAWTHLDLARLDAQTEVDLLPVYLQRAPDDPQTAPPYQLQSSFDLGEGSHLGYAIQWFLFAVVLAVGYPIYVQRQETDLHSHTE